MPFTLAHPAAALPIRRWLGERVVPSALVIGTMVPDLPYFILLGWPHERTHTLLSLLWWSLPAGWGFFLLYRKLLRAPLAYLIPEPLRARMSPTPAPSPPGAVTLSLLLGALSHLLWDALTHESPMFFGTASRNMIFGLLQHGSSVLGIGVLLWWMRRLVRRESPLPERHPEVLPDAHRDTIRAVLLVFPLVFGLSYATVHLPAWHRSWSGEAFVDRAVVQGTSSFLMLLVAFGIFWTWRARAARPGEASRAVAGTDSDTRSPP